MKSTRDKIGDEVHNLECQLVVGAAIGIALTLLSGGLSDLLATAAGVARATAVGARIATLIEELAVAAGEVLRPAMYILDPVGAAAGDLGALMGSRATMFSMELSGDAVRAGELAHALTRIPGWAGTELQRALDPDVLRKALEDGGVPKSLIDDAIKNNPYRNMTPDEIIDRYWDTSRNSWDYPPDHGFAGPGTVYHDINDLPKNLKFDRIGGESGGFIGEEGDSYTARALSPGKAEPYHTYTLTGNPLPEGWTVREGPAASAFGQPGGAHQWVFYNKDHEIATIEELKDVMIIRSNP